MAEIYRLCNKIKHYKWGSDYLIPRFLGIENDTGEPYAEMWMGTHKSAPSRVKTSDELKELTDISGELPFLFKLIAIEKPLSIQAHPDRKQAFLGFRKEEESMLSVNDPARNYKDLNHKMEIICAIEPITLMAGFMEPCKILKSFEELVSLCPLLNEIITPLISVLKNGSISGFFNILFNISGTEMESLCSFIREKDENIKGSFILNEQWKLIKKFSDLYPNDPAILSPLFINLINLKPGQAVYIPSGVLHAYISGFGVEVMTSSDNVLRGGLTAKHIDTGELMNILQFIPFYPDIITPSSAQKCFFYNTPCKEFLFAYMRGSQVFEGSGPAICLVTEGELEINSFVFKKGESFFIPENSSPFTFTGDFSLYAVLKNAGKK